MGKKPGFFGFRFLNKQFGFLEVNMGKKPGFFGFLEVNMGKKPGLFPHSPYTVTKT